MEDALSVIERWLAHPRAQVVNPGERHAEVLGRLLRSAGAAGNLTTDAHLAALAIEQGATLVSFDRDFARLKVCAGRRPSLTDWRASARCGPVCLRPCAPASVAPADFLRLILTRPGKSFTVCSIAAGAGTCGRGAAPEGGGCNAAAAARTRGLFWAAAGSRRPGDFFRVTASPRAGATRSAESHARKTWRNARKGSKWTGNGKARSGQREAAGRALAATSPRLFWGRGRAYQRCCASGQPRAGAAPSAKSEKSA